MREVTQRSGVSAGKETGRERARRRPACSQPKCQLAKIAYYGTLAVVRSRPDGYTLLITSFGLAANPSLYKKLPFDPQTDL